MLFIGKLLVASVLITVAKLCDAAFFKSYQYGKSPPSYLLIDNLFGSVFFVGAIMVLMS